MNRQEAINIIKTVGKHAIDAGIMPLSDIVDACAQAVEALSYSELLPTTPKYSQQPDPATGLVRCGCGGKARVSMITPVDGGFVQCSFCETRTQWCAKEEEAIKYWNKAMSGGSAG
jgi:hypothetical protein